MHHVSLWYFRLLVIAATVTYVLAVTCYTCNGDGCGDPFDESQAVQISCNGSCLKERKRKDSLINPSVNPYYVQTVADVHFSTDVQRHCIGLPSGVSLDDNCNKVEGKETCFCSTDLCNGSGKRNISLISVITCIMSFLALVLLK
ncbi:uncharacterized protein LOC132743804 [Ruditapes philippinarum]|uniref:uncharacterized protein LOC132743804 n=1 Tax=Ruditapes philippinarum TaxID=129788 RepID=UPI00295A8C1A|nr:uncharacterized protein LOC132743804 [Ruditapes philippinarum]